MRKWAILLGALLILGVGALPALAITWGELDTEHPFVGAMVVDYPGIGPYQVCSGTLIHPRVVLTAGHCTVDWEDTEVETFWVNFDPSHIIVQGDEPARIPDELGDKIRHVHLKDGDGRFPEFSFPPLGQGQIDFADLVRRLRNAGYDGALSVEYEAQAFGFELSEPEIVDGEKRFIDRLIREV